jgi:hypothetical protein
MYRVHGNENPLSGPDLCRAVLAPRELQNKAASRLAPDTGLANALGLHTGDRKDWNPC